MSPRAFMMAFVSPAAEALESELATLSASVASAIQRQLTLIRELEPTAIWAAHGATSYVAWLGWRIGLAPNAAREKIRVARALGQLPAIDDAFSRGRLSYSKVRALTRVADASNEAELLGMARKTTASHLEKICRGLRRVVRDEQGAVVEAPPPERWVRERATDDGMVRIEAQLSPDEAALVWKALELARGIGGSGTVIDAADGLVRVADAFRRALTIRDCGCRFPGCDHHAWIDAHHLEHWAHGGETKLANLVSLCSAHHRLVHEGGFTVALAADGSAVFLRPDGAIVVAAPMLPGPAIRGTSFHGRTSAEAPFDDTTLLPDWDGRTPDYDACVTAVRSRRGVIDPASLHSL